ncbi:MAG: hypothetical protein IH994_11235 [Proteobacteria bacterium]|nr:hypothetical protein [Pseudomonadota bacterium]
MIRKTVITAIIAVFALGAFNSPALAGHCPSDLEKIKASMSKISKEMMPMSMNMMKQAIELHNAGKHKESLEVLHKTMKMSGIKH